MEQIIYRSQEHKLIESQKDPVMRFSGNLL